MGETALDPNERCEGCRHLKIKHRQIVRYEAEGEILAAACIKCNRICSTWFPAEEPTFMPEDAADTADAVEEWLRIMPV